MSQSNKAPHHLVIRPRKGAEGQTSTGANTEVLLDGKVLAGCHFVKFEANARKVTKVQLEIYACVECEANVHLEQQPDEETGMTMKGKNVVLRQIGSYNPTGIATKKTSPDGVTQDE
jgi:hypothetical protein